MTDGTIQQIGDFAERLRRLGPSSAPDRFAGRGIVIAAGGAQIFTNAYVLIALLRQTLGCTLPIEVWHFGAQEMSRTMAALLREMDVVLVDAFPRIEAAGATITDGWQLKPFALAQCGFAEVLLLDADQVPIRDPAELFETAQYRESGAVFWPDIVGLRADNPVWAALGLEPARPEMSFESGQLLVDKRRHWRALTMAMAISQESDLAYRYIYGDKDAFLLAWRLAEESYALVPHPPMRGERCLYQRDFAGAPLFQHRTGGKFAYATEEPPTDGFHHLDECNAALRRLRQRWNGRIFWPPDRSTAARAMEQALAVEGRFRLVVAGDETAELELWPFGEFGAGRSHRRQNWWCEERQGQIELLFRDDERISYCLRRQGDGSWQGVRLLYGEAIALLVPQLPASAVPRSPGLLDQLLAAVSFPEAGGDEWEGFCAATKLLSRVDPAVLARLEEIAETAAPEQAARLKELAATIRSKRRVNRSSAPQTTLDAYYRRLDGDEPA